MFVFDTVAFDKTNTTTKISLSNDVINSATAALQAGGVNTSVYRFNRIFTKTDSALMFTSNATTTDASVVGFMQNNQVLLTLRDQKLADIVVMIVDEMRQATNLAQISCGATYGAPEYEIPKGSNWKFAYVALRRDCLIGDRISGGHELGHVLYAEHEKGYNEQTTSLPAPDNHGWINSTTREQTIMAHGEGACGTPPCIWHEMFSNPSKKFVSGLPAGKSSEANLASFITRPFPLGDIPFVAVSKYEPRTGDGGGFTGQPSQVDVEPQYCYAYNRVILAQVAGAVLYEIWCAIFGDWRDPALVYRGTSRNKLINIAPFNYIYIKGYACKAGQDCGEDTDGDELAVAYTFCY